MLTRQTFNLQTLLLPIRQNYSQPEINLVSALQSGTASLHASQINLFFIPQTHLALPTFLSDLTIFLPTVPRFLVVETVGAQ